MKSSNLNKKPLFRQGLRPMYNWRVFVWLYFLLHQILQKMSSFQPVRIPVVIPNVRLLWILILHLFCLLLLSLLLVALFRLLSSWNTIIILLNLAVNLDVWLVIMMPNLYLLQHLHVRIILLSIILLTLWLVLQRISFIWSHAVDALFSTLAKLNKS